MLAGGVAHDFNNLLTTIIGNAELALMELSEDIPIHGNIDEIRKAGKKAASLTRQLLAFSRKQVIQPEMLDLNEVLKSTEKMLRRLIGEDIDLLTVLEPEPWLVYADPGQMDQVIMNLAVNARDAMPRGGKLTIETANVELDHAYFLDHGIENRSGEYVMLAVTDTGVGMDKETQSRIFDPFFTTKERGRGTGLGLSTVYGIVKQNRGYVWVYSEPAKGSTFKVYLPRATSGAPAAEQQKLPKGQLRGSETILVVEDDETVREMAQSFLELYGYRVLVARDGKDAMEVADRHEEPVHVLLTDVVMPGMDGRELAERLRAKLPGMKVIFMSGYTDNAIAHHGVLEEGVVFIQKPFYPDALAAKVREALGK